VVCGWLAVASLGCAALPPSEPIAQRASAQICADAQPASWPTSPFVRRLLLAKLQLVLSQCMDDAQFLAQYGGLLLENEDAAQALTWLERSLLLDPGNLGAQADHAIALAALGEPEALRALAEAWRERSDIPAGLRERLFPLDPASRYALPNTRLGGFERPQWGLQGEFSAVVGHESNLDRSPRLTELTLTVPEGPLVLPVISQPRQGTATLTSAAIRVGYALGERTILRSSLNLNVRHAVSAPGTNWRQSQWTTEVEHRVAGWRLQADAGIALVGGPLNEPYRLHRFGLAAEIKLKGCGARAGGSHDRREQSATDLLNSSTDLWTANLQCPLPGLSGWLVSVNLSRGDDTPQTAGRPGGPQKLRATGWRISGLVGSNTRIEFHVRDSDVADAEGYSVLLDNNAIRRLSVRQLSLDLSQSLQRFGLPGWSATLQWQRAAQESNIQLFGYRARTVYGGLSRAW